MLPAPEPEDSAEIARYARLILQRAGVGDRLPTPVADIVACAELVVSQDITLSEVHADFFSNSFGVLHEALNKVLGLVDLREKVIYLDTTQLPQKQSFVKLHEVGHDVLPWQRAAYIYLDDETTLDPQVKDLFEQQANQFAAHVLFQLDRFEKDSADLPLSIRSPLALAKRYGASVHATLRRYVETSKLACALVVTESVPEVGTRGSFLRVRQAIQSPKFVHRFATLEWQPRISCDLPYIEPLVRNGRLHLIENHEVQLDDVGGMPIRCAVEVFSNTYNFFILIFPLDERVRSRTRIELVR